MGRKLANSSKCLRSCTLMLREAATDRRCDRALQSDLGALDGVNQFLGDVFAIFLKCFGTGCVSFPLELYAGRFQNAYSGPGDFGANSIAGDQSYCMSHSVVPVFREGEKAD